jgi:hypothetical protein
LKKVRRCPYFCPTPDTKLILGSLGLIAIFQITSYSKFGILSITYFGPTSAKELILGSFDAYCNCPRQPEKS